MDRHRRRKCIYMNNTLVPSPTYFIPTRIDLIQFDFTTMTTSVAAATSPAVDEETRLGLELISACTKGDYPAVDSLLSQGAPAYYQEVEGGTSCLMHAAKGGYLPIVQRLLAAGMYVM